MLIKNHKNRNDQQYAVYPKVSSVLINNPFRGSAIAKIVGANAMKYNNIFETRVTMYVYEEIINNEKLTDIINTLHENVKYLPGHKLPENVASILNISVVLLMARSVIMKDSVSSSSLISNNIARSYINPLSHEIQ